MVKRTSKFRPNFRYHLLMIITTITITITSAIIIIGNATSAPVLSPARPWRLSRSQALFYYYLALRVLLATK